MNVKGKNQKSIWYKIHQPDRVSILDQRFLPHKEVVEQLTSTEEVVTAIREMHVRGAPLIGVTAAFGVYFAICSAKKKEDFWPLLMEKGADLKAARPTAVNLAWAVDRMLNSVNDALSLDEIKMKALEEALEIYYEEEETCRKIGDNGLAILEEIYRTKNDTVNVLTHCNAGWLACVDYGTATAPIYKAHDAGIPVHVWVDETRPRLQGALTAWELGEHGIPHTIIVDNAGGHLMQHGMVDVVITGCDRASVTGDCANKIGTYLKALAAYDNDIPFYVALPSSTFDSSIQNGVKEIPIEERDAEEVRVINGMSKGVLTGVEVFAEGSNISNFGFDVTPARLVTGLITDRGICAANAMSIADLFPEFQPIA